MSKYTISASDGKNQRLDKFLSVYISKSSRSTIKKMINEGLVFVNGETTKPSFILDGSEKISYDLIEEKEKSENLTPQNIDLDIIYEDKNTLAFKDINPQAPIHILIIPKKLIDMPQNVTKEDNEILGNLFFAAKEIAKKLNVTNGYRLVMNNGEEAGQSVFHIHLHFLSGRKLNWPPG